MADPSVVANVVGIIVGTISILATAKSVYNGAVRSAVNHIGMIPEVADSVEELSDCVSDIKSEQEDIKEGVVAISEAQARDGVTIDPDGMARELGVKPQIDRFYDERRYGPHSDD